MDIQVKKLELIEWIAQISDVNIISKMDKIRKTYLTMSNENINPMTVKEFYASIERAEEDIKSGRIYTQEEVEKESENW
jgi:predicted transcriptional regulator